MGQSPNVFYIVKEGKLTMETVLEIDYFYKIPINSKQWHVRRTTKRLMYKLKDLTQGGMVGHEEMLQGLDHKCRLRALTHCSLIYCNKDAFLNKIPPKYIDRLREIMTDFDVMQIASKILKSEENKKYRSKAIFDATKVNNFDIGGTRALNLIH